MKTFPEDRRKLKELILYISQQYKSDPSFGFLVLNKVLFFSDFIAYGKLGSPITGAEYKREKRGPVPRVIRDGARSPLLELKREGAATITETPTAWGTLITAVPLREADTSVFSPEELEVVNQVVESFRGWRGGTLSKYTHQFVGWQSVPLDETIPYETIFFGPDQRLSADEIKFGQALAHRFGWVRTSR